MSLSGQLITRPFASAGLAIALVVAVAGETSADDYVRDKVPSSVAKAYFAAVSGNLPLRKVVRREAQPDGEGEAYYTEDGAISIPPRAMVTFKLHGRCMDPHLPAPSPGEPMQFVDVARLVPRQLREMYDTLIKRQSQGDPNVLAGNPQHLVWAIRTAGTDDPFANNLSDSQLAILDACAGRRGAFMKYHERAKKRNARKNRKAGYGGGRISVGGYSYDAADLRGTNGIRRIEQHMSTLTEMGEKSTVRTESDFRYGEIDEELYSDIACDGGLSFTAKVLNASDRRKEFRAADFAAQVGNGSANGCMRQRVTMGTPDEFMVVAGAVREGLEIEHNMSSAEVEGEALQRIRGRSSIRRSARSGERHTRRERTSEKSRGKRTETTTVVEAVTPVSPVLPVPPIVIHDIVTNETVRTVAEEVNVRVVSLEYDTESRNGLLAIEILGGSFTKVTKYVRKNFDGLVRKKSPAEAVAKIPAEAKLEIDSISINDDDRCEVKFVAKMAETGT